MKDNALSVNKDFKLTNKFTKTSCLIRLFLYSELFLLTGLTLRDVHMEQRRSFIVYYLLILILTLVSSTGVAQNTRFTFSYSPVVPVSFMEDANPGLISGNIGFSVDIVNKLSWITTVGYNKFGTRTTNIHGTEDEYKSSLAFIPVTTGIQYFIKETGATHYANREKGTRFYGVFKGGYYFPSGDLVKGDPGINTGAGVQIASKSGKSKFDVSLCYNGVLGARTKIFESGSLSQETTYKNLSYLELNFGLVFGL